MRSGGFDPWRVVSWGVWVLLAVLLAWPLSTILRASLIDADGAAGLGNYAELLARPRYARALGNTLLAGAGGAGGALLLGGPLVFLLRSRGGALDARRDERQACAHGKSCGNGVRGARLGARGTR